MELLFPYIHRVFRWFLLSMLDANGTFVMNPAGCVCVVSLSCMLYKDIMFYSLNNAETVNFLHQSFPVIKKALAMLLTLTAGLLSKEKNNHKRHNLKSWWLGKHLSAGEQTATQHQHSPLSDSLSVHSWFTLLLLFHLTWRELPGGNNASSCVGCVLADVLPPSVWVILCFYGNQSIFGWFSFSTASPQCNQC